jgi:hypothetical protein
MPKYITLGWLSNNCLGALYFEVYKHIILDLANELQNKEIIVDCLSSHLTLEVTEEILFTL